MIDYLRLNHIQLCIPKNKEDEARIFYRDIMGLKEISKPAQLLANGGLWFQIADIQLHIGTENELNKSKRHPAFQVRDIKAAREALTNAGIQIKEEIKLEGQERFSFFDPFGNRIELLQKF